MLSLCNKNVKKYKIFYIFDFQWYNSIPYWDKYNLFK